MKWISKKFIINKEFAEGIAVILALLFMILVFAPLELYLNNRAEFWFDFNLLLPALIKLFLSAMIINILLFAVLFRCNKKVYRVVVIAEFIIFIILYIQGNFLVNHLPLLTGPPVLWENYTKEHLKSLILIVVVITGIIWLFKRRGMFFLYKIMAGSSVFITLVLLTTIVTIFYMNQGNAAKERVVVTTKNLLEMSEDTNFIILVLDTMDARNVSKLLADSPETVSELKDFSYYPNTMGAYAHTRESIPFILSGEWFENEQPFIDYNVNVYKNSKLLNTMEKDGYKLGVYSTEMPANDKSVFRFENVAKVVTTEWKMQYLEFFKAEMKLVGYKYLPYGLKQMLSFDINAIESLNQIVTDSETFSFYKTNQVFYHKLLQEDITTTEQKCFKFIHIEGAHPPFRYDKNMNVDNNKGTSYERSVEASLTIINQYLEKLKQNNVYDNSVIVLLGDHGYFADNVAEDKQNPMLLVKGLNEHHDLQISDAPISYADLQEAFVRLKNGNKSYDIFDWKEGQDRERRYLFSPDTNGNSLIEYIQRGKASDANTMYKTGREYKQ